MKKVLVMTVVAVVLMATASSAAVASDIAATMTPEQYARVEANLLVALASDNQGLRESAAYWLGEIKSTRAVIPLMAMLRNSDCGSSLNVAALALCRIGDARGAYAVKRMAIFGDDECFRNRCAWYYEQYVSAGTFVFPSSGGEGAVEVANR